MSIVLKSQGVQLRLDLSPFWLVVGMWPTVWGDIGLNNQGHSLIFVFHFFISLPLLPFVSFVWDGKLDSVKANVEGE